VSETAGTDVASAGSSGFSGAAPRRKNGILGIAPWWVSVRKLLITQLHTEAITPLAAG
jgi:hypothetical protein